MTKFTEYTLDALAIGTFLFLVGRFILLYMNGCFTYKEEIHSEESFRIKKEDGWVSVNKDITRIVTKRTYENGRIEFRTKEF